MTPERFLTVETPDVNTRNATHITLNPPVDNRRRAVEKFAFTTVFEEDRGQLDVFEGSGVLDLVSGVLGAKGGEGRDGLLATLGVTGSGKVCSAAILSFCHITAKCWLEESEANLILVDRHIRFWAHAANAVSRNYLSTSCSDP